MLTRIPTFVPHSGNAISKSSTTASSTREARMKITRIVSVSDPSREHEGGETSWIIRTPMLPRTVAPRHLKVREASMVRVRGNSDLFPSRPLHDLPTARHRERVPLPSPLKPMRTVMLKWRSLKTQTLQAQLQQVSDFPNYEYQKLIFDRSS